MKNLYRVLQAKKAAVATSVMTMVASGHALALTKTDLTQDTAGGLTLENVAENLDDTTQTFATLVLSIVAFGGFVVVALSVYQLYKASKDEREKPTSAFVGIVVGGLMSGISTVMWTVQNSLLNP